MHYYIIIKIIIFKIIKKNDPKNIIKKWCINWHVKKFNMPIDRNVFSLNKNINYYILFQYKLENNLLKKS